MKKTGMEHLISSIYVIEIYDDGSRTVLLRKFHESGQIFNVSSGGDENKIEPAIIGFHCLEISEIMHHSRERGCRRYRSMDFGIG